MEKKYNIIAGVRNKNEFLAALKSPAEYIFVLNFQNILNVEEIISLTHRVGKKAFIHFDFLDGVGKDRYGIRYLKNKGADGIITTKTNLIINAREEGLITVQRFFIIDTKAVQTAFDAINSSLPDMVEVMPGIMPEIIAKFVENVKSKVIAGGLIASKEHVEDALKAGATAVSTTKEELWSL